MKSATELDPLFLENSFMGLNHVFSVQIYERMVWYICLSLIDFSAQKYTLFTQNFSIVNYTEFKNDFKAKKLFARIRGIQLSSGLHSQETL